MKYALIICLLVVLSACAGLNTAWILHMEYATPQEPAVLAKPAKSI